MKKILFVFILFSSTKCFCQTDSAITYSEVVKVDSVTKDVLYVKARDWFNNTFKDSKEVLQIADKETGEISGKGIFYGYIKHSTLGVDNSYKNSYRFKITIWVKDSKYKYILTDIDNYDGALAFGIITTSDHTDMKVSMVRKKKMDEYYMAAKNAALVNAQGIILQLKDAMNKRSDASNF